ncbi:MAG: O-antigen ligase family protein [Clostridia bacterium]|nr:O-antigen ligase family protein [Clostridia bacterium]
MNKKGQSGLTASDRLMGIFLFIVVAIIPLICRLSQVAVSGEEYNVIRTGEMLNDLFSYSKSVLILTMGVIITLFMAFQILGEDGFTIDFKSKPVILAGVYVLFALVSSVFSKYHHTAFFGVSERYEGFFVWLCYMVFMVVAMAFASDKKRLNFILGGFFISGLLVGLIGLLQFLGYNIFSTEWFSKLVMGDAYDGVPMKIKFDSVFATLYNPNCAGMYYGMMFSAFGVMAVLMPLKNKFKWIFAVLSIMLLVCAIGANSVGGFIGITTGVGFTAVVCMCYYVFAVKSKRAAGITAGVIAACVIGLIVLFNSNAVIVKKFNIIVDALKSGEALNESASFYEDVEVDGMLGKVITKDGEFAIDYAAEATQFMHNGTVLNPISEEPMENGRGTKYVFNESGVKWSLYLYNMESKNIFVASLIGADEAGTETYFLFGEVDGKLSVLDKFGNAVDIDTPVESWGFKGVERLGSNRGYIWSRSLPLLKHNIIIGSGVDTYVFEFPQNDVRSKLNFLGNPYVIIDKPHNMFLQIGINTGVISLIVMIVMFVLYIVQTIKRVFNDKSQCMNAIRLGILAGVIAYIMASMTTDSVVSVAPVFWTLLGTGFGANVIKAEENV